MLIGMFSVLVHGRVARVSLMQSQTAFFGKTTYDSSGMTDTVSTKDHLTVTAQQSRDDLNPHEVIITKISDISPTVKHLVLTTSQRPIPFSFKAGQWVDMFIPGLDTVGGFSITSSPMHLSKTGEVYLAVKHSESLPSKWVHTKCKEGNAVSIRVGGDFHLKTDQLPSQILFIAGGVGINPLASMISEIRDFTTKMEVKPLQATLLFSAKTHEELIFKEVFDAIQSSWFKPLYFVTGMNPMEVQLKHKTISSVNNGRIMAQDVQRIISNSNTTVNLSELHVYLCGPPDMTKTLQEALSAMGVQNIFFEKWW